MWYEFLVTDCDFHSNRCGLAGTLVAVITVLPCSVAPEPSVFITFRGALCGRLPDILQLWTWFWVDKKARVCIQANKMQTSAAVWTFKYCEMQFQWAHCAVYPLIVCFGLCAKVSLTREKSTRLFKFCSWTDWCPWQESRALNFEVQAVICYCGLKHTTVASACVMCCERKLLFGTVDVATAFT